MTQCLEYIFCCLWLKNDQNSRNQRQTIGAQKKKKQNKQKPKPSRIISKYKPQDIIEMSKQQKKNSKFVYTCPICTLFFNRILACTDCHNNMCRFCVRSYQEKFQLSPINMKCPFCNSQTSNFIDYEQQAKSYFDTTGRNGFLDPVQRRKIDEQMKWNQSKKLENDEHRRSKQLSRIEEEQMVENAVPTRTNLEGQIENNQNQNNNDNQQNSLSQFRNSQNRMVGSRHHDFHLTV